MKVKVTLSIRSQLFPFVDVQRIGMQESIKDCGDVVITHDDFVNRRTVYAFDRRPKDMPLYQVVWEEVK